MTPSAQSASEDTFCAAETFGAVTFSRKVTTRSRVYTSNESGSGDGRAAMTNEYPDSPVDVINTDPFELICHTLFAC
jgi:hypothetical protein